MCFRKKYFLILDVQRVHTIEHLYEAVRTETRENVEQVIVLFKGVFFNSAKEVRIKTFYIFLLLVDFLIWITMTQVRRR